MKLALFPLPIFLLPAGRTKLRVFEPRYQRLVKESAGEQGFVILPFDNLTHLDEAQSRWGSHVFIVDFEQGDDGLLHIEVECRHMVIVDSFDIEFDGLKRAICRPGQHWEEGLHRNTSNTSTSQGVESNNQIVNTDKVQQYDEKREHLAPVEQHTNNIAARLSAQLQTAFDMHPELREMYPQTHFDSPQWVCRRWLELLPLTRNEQNLFAQANSFERAFQFLNSIVS